MPSMSHDKQKTEKAACTELHNTLTYADLPLSCPPQDTRVWDAHPRVYLPIEELGKVTCPYCGAQYVLQDFVPANEKLPGY
jgi:uncharacterized Zn-finger protein